MSTPVPCLTPLMGPKYALPARGCQGESGADGAEGAEHRVVPLARFANSVKRGHRKFGRVVQGLRLRQIRQA